MEDSCTPTMTVSEPDMKEYKAWAFEHRDALASELAEAGASEHFIDFVQMSHKGVRDSILMTLFRHHLHDSENQQRSSGSSIRNNADSQATADEASEPNQSSLSEAYQLGGGFFTKLWDGELASAYMHADGNNQSMIEDVFTKDEVIRVGVEQEDMQRNYIEQIVNERWG